MNQNLDFAPYRPLEFEVRGPFCDGEQCNVPAELMALEFEVKEVLGTSPKVAVGERYVVRGQYRLPGGDPYAVSVAVYAKAFGASAYLFPGEGRFETSTEILELMGDPPNGLGMVVANERTGKCEIVRWIMLRE